MKYLAKLLIVLAGASFCTGAVAQNGNFYLGPQLSYIDLDSDRDNLTRDGALEDTGYLGLGFGYQYNENWAAELSFLTDLGNELSVDTFNINGFRFFGKDWRPFVMAGFSHYEIDEVSDQDTDQIQVGAGISRFFGDNLEARLWGQHMYDMGAESNNDNAVTFALNYHFAKPKPKAAAAAPVAAAPAPAVAAQPESVVVEEQVLETIELLVEFDTDKHFIRSVYQPQFDRIGRTIKENPDVDVIIEGHTDWRASEAYNQALSERRANAVKEKLVQDYRVDAARIRTVGYGESRPKASNDTAEGMQRNRRAVAVFTVRTIIKKPR